MYVVFFVKTGSFVTLLRARGAGLSWLHRLVCVGPTVPELCRPLAACRGVAGRRLLVLLPPGLPPAPVWAPEGPDTEAPVRPPSFLLARNQLLGARDGAPFLCLIPPQAPKRLFHGADSQGIGQLH